MESSSCVAVRLKFLLVSHSNTMTTYALTMPFTCSLGGGLHRRRTEFEVSCEWITATGGAEGAGRGRQNNKLI